jgi:hypothetical protein
VAGLPAAGDTLVLWPCHPGFEYFTAIPKLSVSAGEQYLWTDGDESHIRWPNRDRLMFRNISESH